ncbi:MAG: nuclear transport factor 2 family protein [Candidatus Aminicenantes bacterium]|nr:nuclear transport factor 2 family protein [Candidatus Aminicenantes bacterium]
MNINKKLTYAFLVIFFFIVGNSIFGNIKNEKDKILETVNKFLKVLETGDTGLAKEILVIEGSNFSIREEGGSYKIKHTNYNELIASLPEMKGRYKEIITDPEILVHKNIAVLWAKYKFFIDGKFSHCGVDSFSLIKIEDKWKIASIIYTVEKKGCK